MKSEMTFVNTNVAGDATNNTLYDIGPITVATNLLTYSVTLTDTTGNVGAVVTAAATLDRTAPTATTTAAMTGRVVPWRLA